MSSLADLIATLRDKNVRVWEDNGDLRLSAPRDALSRELTDTLRTRKTELLEFLRAARGPAAPRRAVEPHAAGGPQPLSFAQERLWFLEMMGGAGAAYNVAAAVRITGDLRADALSQAFAEVQRRHDVLRARFVEINGQPSHIVRPEATPLEHVDWSHAQPDDAVAAAQEDARRPFNVARDPLLRARLFSSGPRQHLLALTVHHLISDGLSLGILVREIVELYQSIAHGAVSSLPPLPYQYADFAAAQRQWLQGDALDRQVRYWREQLTDAPDALALPPDRPRPSVTSFRGATCPVRVAGNTADAVHRYARATGATPFMILLAAYAAMLARTAGQDEVVVGIPVANRFAEGSDRLIGLFVNALPIRVECRAGDSFGALVGRVKDAVLAALAHGEVPWEFLLDALQPRRDLSRTPVFQATFALQDDPAGALRIPGLAFEPVPLATGAAKFEMSLELAQGAGGTLAGELEYNSDLFDHATTARFVDRCLHLLDRAVRAPDARLADIDVVPDAERAALVRSARGPDVAFALDSNLPRAFAACVQRHPDRAAVVLRDRVITFTELDREAGKIALALINSGVRPGHAVGIVADRTPETMAALWGVYYAGGAYVPLDPAWPARRLEQVIALAGCGAILLHDARRSLLPPEAMSMPVLRLEDVAARTGGAGASWPDPSDADPAYVLFTSGSTGEPKGVVIEQRSVLHLIAALERAVYEPLGLGQSGRVSVNGALTFDTSVKQIFQLLQGRTLVLVPDDVRLDGAALVAYAKETGIEVLDCTPSQLALLADAGLGEDPGPVRAVFSGGEALTAALWSRLRGAGAPRVVNLYGPTECTVDATVHLIERDEDVPVLGRPLPNVQVLVLDRELRPVPDGMPGELFIGGAGLAREYLGDPDLTRARFLANPFPGIPSTRLYRTGDRGRVRPDGRLEYLGRLDHQIKVRGHRIELAEIERTLDAHPSVRASCALVVGDDDRRLVACAAVDPVRSNGVNGRERYRLPNGLAVAQLNANETDFLYGEMFERNAYLRHGVTIRDGDVVLDVGSNIGLFALSMHVQRAGLRFVCVEPNPRVREILTDNLRIFGMDAAVFDCGVSAREGSADFTFYPDFSILSGLHADLDADKAVVRSYIRRQTEGAGVPAGGIEEVLDAKFRRITVPVRLRPLCDVIASSGIPRVDLLKINVEKAELDVLLGIADAQWPLIRQIAVEVHDVGGRLETVLSMLRARGFRATAEEDWSLERSAGTNYYVYAVRDDRAPEQPADPNRLLAFTPALITAADLRTYLEERLPDYAIPSAILLLDRLPVNAHGKVDRRALANLPWKPGSGPGDEPLAPLSADELALADLWKDILHVDRVAAGDHFFRLGGHSLSAVRLATRVRDVFRRAFSVGAVFEHPVLRDMAVHFRAGEPAGPQDEPLSAVAPQSETGQLALSYAQERLLFLEHLEGGGSAYVIAGAAELSGVLNVPALGSALHSLADRHAVLRSVFSLQTGRAEARILERTPELEEHDWSGVPDAERWTDALAWMRQRAAEPFDLANGLPIRVALLRLAPARHVLFVAFHHLVADGWSVALFIRELSAWYRFHLGAGAPPAPLRLGYYDFARWQRASLGGRRLDRDLAYWTERLADSPPFIDLPTDRPRPTFNTYRGAMFSFDLPAQVRDRVADRCRDLDATPYMLLLGVFGAVLNRWSGQRDILIGSPAAGRGHSGTEDLIGLFVNTLVMRLELSGSPTFRDVLAGVRRSTLGAFAHQDLPFERIVEALRPPRLLNRHPIFQVVFALQNLPAESLDLPDITWATVPIDTPTGRFDLALVIDEAAGDDARERGYRASIEYSPDLFDEATIARLAAQYQTLLNAALENPDGAIATVDLAGPADRHLLGTWNRIEPDATGPPFQGVHQMVARHAGVRPSAPAISYRGVALSYDALHRRVRALAAAIERHGVRAGDVVAIYTDRSPAWVLGALASLHAKAVFLPIDPDYPLERVRWTLGDSGAALVLTQRARWEELGAALARVLFVDEENVEPPPEDDDRGATPAPDDPAYLIYTSGSTGQPKGALNTHGGLTNLTRNFVDLFETGPDTRALHFSSIGFDSSLAEVFIALAAGGCACLADREEILPGAPLADTLRTQRITHATIPPSVLGGMMDTGFPDLRVLISAGEACPPELVRRWGTGRRFFNGYGPTESAVCATIAECAPGTSRVTIGRPLRNVCVYILDEAMQPVPAGIAGELFIGGAGVSAGYWRRPELTAEKFVEADPDGTGAPLRLYRTGDLGRFLADGAIEFLGRRDQQIKLRGFRIELGEIEAALRAHPAVQDCAVVVQHQGGEQPRLTAFIVSHGERAGTRALKEYLRARLPDYMVPSVFVDLERLPVTANIKIDRRALEHWTIAPSQDERVVDEPASATARAVAALFAEVLNRAAFGPRDDFFEHGGHSLLAAQIIARVRERFGAELTLRALFEAPTPEALAARIDAAIVSTLPALTPGARFEDRAILSSAQRRLWFIDQLDGSPSAYNLASAVRLRGALDVPVFRATIAALGERHEMLRSCYPAEHGEPRVRLLDDIPALEVVQIAGSTPAERWSNAVRLAQALARAPFTLAAGPLFRPVLYQLGDDDFLFAVSMHHIVSDGWSIDVLVREIAGLYRAMRNSEPQPPVPGAQYGDYARWLERAIEGPRLAEQVEFWTARLDGAPARIELPADYGRPPVQTFRGGAVPFTIDPVVTARLRALARQCDASLFMTVLAAFMAWLSRYSSQDDLVVGTPVANRRLREVEPVVGLFVNTLALRARVTAGERFSTLLRRVRNETLDAFSYADVPFETLVGILQPERHLSHTPLFQVMFAMTSGLVGALDLPNVMAETLTLESDSAKFDLTLFVEEGEHALTATLEYNADLFHADTARRMADTFGVLLAGIAREPETAVGDLPLLGQADRAALRAWNNTAVERDERTVCDLFEEQAVRVPRADAIAWESGRLDYGELDARANQLAQHLRSVGVERETLVALYLKRSADLIVALLGILKAGGAYVPIDIHYPEARVAFMLNDSQAAVIVTNRSLEARLPPSNARIVALDRDWAVIDERPGTPPAHRPGPRDLAYMIYTSGSTGVPKGVLVEHGGLANYLVWAAREYRVHEGTGAPVVGSVSFDATITSIFGPLVAGQRIILLPEGRELETLGSAELARADHSFYKITPSHLEGLNALLGDAPLDGRVREMVIGGEALAGAILEPWRAGAPHVMVTNEYGPTETVVGCAVFRRRAGDMPRDTIPIGRPIANTAIHLLDERQRPVPIGVAGEIYIGGAGVARGYHARLALTSERFVDLTIPELMDGGAPVRFYRTGDLARWTRDGELLFLGRRDGQVKLRGHRIELREIEAAARSFAGVAHAAVVVQHPGGGDARLALYLVGPPGLNTAGVRDHLVRELPAIMVPAAVRQIDALPLTPNGKLDRDALARLDDPEPPSAARTARDQVRDLVATIWTTLVGAPPSGPGADFFASGGHSLLAARFTAKIQEALGVKLPLRAIFEHPTLEALAREVAGRRRDADLLPPIERASGEPVLSFGQQRLWALDQLESPGAAYHIAAAFRLRGALDPDALERALQDIARRHDVLRTSFPIRDGRPTVRVNASLPALTRTDLRAQHPDNRDAIARDRLGRLLNEPFDLAEGPLLRAGIYRLDESDWIFGLVLHHLISDGWSSAILADELRASYERHAAGASRQPPPLPIQYSDYAAWQQRALAGGALDRLTAYWTDTLKGAPAAIELPIAGTRPSTQSYRGAVHEFHVEPALRDRLAALARRENATLYMVLLTAYTAMLACWSGQDDLVIGTPVANRSHPGTEGLIGFFVNTLPLRLRIDRGTTTFRALLAQVRDTALRAFDHQELPFERLVEAINPPRNPAIAPIFQVLFSYQQADAADLTLPGISVERVALPHAVAKFDLTLAIDERAAGLDGYLEYAADLFDAAAMRAATDRFLMFLDAMAADAERPVSGVAMLTAAERRQLAAWNDTSRDFHETRLVHQIIEDQARRAPEACALVFKGERMSYGELNARADAVAHELQRAGAGSDVAVGVCLERSFELLTAILGILKAGAAYVPLDPEYPAARLAGMWKDAGLQILVTRQAILDRGLFKDERDAATVVTLEPDFWNRSSPGGDPQPVAANERDLAYIIFTSGSTGRPKGVMIEHTAIRNRLLWMQDAYRLSATDVVLQKTPVSFDVSVWELFWPLMVGARLVIARPGGHRDGAYLAQLIAEAGVTTLHFVPSMLQAFLEEPGIDRLPSLQRVFCSGEALPWEVIHRFRERIGCPLHNLYGPTEAAVDVTAWACQADATAAGGLRRSVPIGRPIANTRIHILDERLQPAAIGVPGELHIGGVNLARGYVNQPALTAERFVANPFADEAGESGRLYRTGDLARWCSDGQIEFLGRRDAQVKLRGFRVELGEIETALMQHPLVAEAAAAVVDDAGHPRLVGYIVPRAAGMPPSADLRRHLQERLPEYMIPLFFVELDALPVGATGKLDRKALPAPRTDRASAGERPGTPVERLLAVIWEEVLGAADIRRDQNFFELGGDSILAIQMAARARRAGLEVSPGLLLEHQTIAALALAAQAARPIVAEQGVLQGPVPAPPIMHWFVEQHLAAPRHFNQAVVLSVHPGLAPDVVERAVRLLVEHHDALRLCWTRGTTTLEYGGIDRAYTCDAIDCRDLSADARRRLVESTAATMQAALDPSDGPLSRLAYFHAGPEEHGRLVWAAHHLAVDGVSWGILIDDLDRVCRALAAGREPVMPPKTSSLRQWVDAWRTAAGAGDMKAERAFWMSMPLDAVRPAPMPAADVSAAASSSLDLDDTRALTSEWPRACHATAQDIVLAAFWSAWAQATGALSLAVDMEGHGRASPVADVDVSRTVGWFTAVYPVALASGPALPTDPQARVDAVRAVTRQVPNGGAGFGPLKYLALDPGLASLPRPAALFNYLGRMDEGFDGRALFGPADEDPGPSTDPRNGSPYAVELSAAVSAGRLRLHWRSPAGGLGQDALDRLAAATQETLEAWAGRFCSQAPVDPSRGDSRAALAAFKARGYSPLVRIKEGRAGEPPLFLVHPGGGTVLCYRDLAARLDVTCYGLQAPGLAEGEQPVGSVEALAAHYRDAVVDAWPSGPYRLGGWSFGGIVAFEMAHLLRADGREVELLAVLDVFAPGSVPDAEWQQDDARLLVNVFAEDLGVEYEHLVSRPLDEQLEHITARAVASGLFPAGFTAEAARRAWAVFKEHRRAEQKYRARPLAAELLLCTSDVRNGEPDPSLGWEPWATRVAVRRVPGNHQQMLRVPSVDILAAALRDHLLPYTPL